MSLSSTNVTELVVVGGGLASARAIRAYREAGGDGAVALVSADATVPYHRPPLSKRLLRGEAEAADTLVEPLGFYEENEVELVLGAEVERLDPNERAVVTRDGRRLRYRKLLLATGALPRRLPVEGTGLDGVFTLRSLDDTAAIRAAAAEARDAVVVGGGFIGVEVAASLTQLGLDVTLVGRDPDLFAQLRSPEISEHLVRLYRKRGVDVVLGDEVRAFRGRSRVDTVELRRGGPVGAGLVVVGIGVVAATAFLEGSGLRLDDGIVVDGLHRTNLPDVYAAGDVARFFDPVAGRSRRVEHWSNAGRQGAAVGTILAGGGPPEPAVSTFFTEAFGLTLKVFGDISSHDDRVVQGSFEDGQAVVQYLERGRLVGALHTGLDAAAEAELERAIRAGAAPAALPATASA